MPYVFYYCAKKILLSFLLQLFMTFKSLVCSCVLIRKKLFKISYILRGFHSQIFVPLPIGNDTPLFPLESMDKQLTDHEIYM